MVNNKEKKIKIKTVLTVSFKNIVLAREHARARGAEPASMCQVLLYSHHKGGH